MIEELPKKLLGVVIWFFGTYALSLSLVCGLIFILYEIFNQ